MEHSGNVKLGLKMMAQYIMTNKIQKKSVKSIGG